jgi:hypothetical protein
MKNEDRPEFESSVILKEINQNNETNTRGTVHQKTTDDEKQGKQDAHASLYLL